MTTQPPSGQMPQMPDQGVPSYSTPDHYAQQSEYAQQGGYGPQGQPGAQGQYGPQGQPGAPAPQPPKRNWFARHKFLTGIGAVVALVVGIAAFSGGGDEDTTAAGGTTQEESAQDAGTEEVADEPAGAPAETEPADDEAAQEEPTADEAAPAEDEPAEEAAPADRDNSSAELTTLGAGTFIVGEDLPPGRYVIEAAGGQSGNISATSADNPLTINEILGDAGGFGVPSVTSTLVDGEEISISGLSEVTLTPAETELRTTLGAGEWVVGLDIAPGSYVATPADGQSGNFVIYDEFGWPDTNEILGDADGFGVPEVTVSLADGDQIEISGLAEVSFAER